jgi:hypothetical protein
MGSEVTLEMVIKIKRRFRQQQDRDSKLWVSCNMAQMLMEGSQERLVKLRAMYDHWDGLEEMKVSACCEYPIEKHDDTAGNVYYRCLKCDTTCKTRMHHREDVEKLKIKLLQEMRKESDHIVKYTKTLGFVPGNEGPETPAIQQKNYIYVDSSQKENSDVSRQLPITEAEARKIDDMTPMEREKLRFKLEGLLEEEKDQFGEGSIEQVSE